MESITIVTANIYAQPLLSVKYSLSAPFAAVITSVMNHIEILECKLWMSRCCFYSNTELVSFLSRRSKTMLRSAVVRPIWPVSFSRL